MSNYKRDGFTVAGTDIDEVKRKNAESGMSYNEVKAMLAKTNLQGTAIYSDTNAPKIQTENKLKM
ncbi:gamma-type small acid-soluble spore protein [Rummeliibacillus sp. NPDC094406]|uniref:gamma-type small acid-soluble spore protein n=1 Tax=Rummeliibacillus sp. NPDC094406 TaxID=3364511 RepID=UPI00381B4493